LSQAFCFPYCGTSGNDADAYNNRGLIYQQLNDNQKAINYFRQAAKLYQQKNNQTWYKNSLDRLKELVQ
jgi:tetratricopeptide (TPR) repeat protein